MKSVYLFIFLFHQCYTAGIMDNVVFAVNCGGEAHIDTNGIRYRKDYLKSGVASDFGRNSIINRVPKEDMVLYQTERYDFQQLSYEIDLSDDGDYVLWMKFSEVWFNEPNKKVFQILLNDEHSVIDELDIFANAGRTTAHDEYIPFQIKNGRLVVKSRSSSYSGVLKVTFQRLDARDNPKINAIIIWKGTVDQIPKLPPIPEPEQPEQPIESEYDEPPAKQTKTSRKLKTSGPKIVDPYTQDQSSSFLPLILAIAAVIPVIFCLCRL